MLLKDFIIKNIRKGGALILNIINDGSKVLRELTYVISDNTENNQNYEILQSDFTVNLCNWILQLKNGEIDNFTKNKIQVQLDNKNKIELNIDNNNISENLTFIDCEKVKSTIRLSQVQLFQWILYQYNIQKSKRININIAEYFNARGLNRRKENMDRLFEDLALLQGINITANIKLKGTDELLSGNIMNFKGYIYSGQKGISSNFITNKKINLIVIELKDWIDKIKLNQYVHTHSNFFKYNCKKDNITIMLSIKFSQLIRTNLSKLNANMYYNCKVRTLLKFLNVTEEDLRKQGTKHYIKLLESSLKVLEKEGYDFKFKLDDSKKYTDFRETKIEYTNKTLLDSYKNIKRKH